VLEDEKGAYHVDVEHTLEDVRRIVDDVDDLAAVAGVGEDHVVAAEALDARSDGSLDRRLVGHIGDRGERVELLGRRGERLLLESDEMQLRAFGLEQPGGGEPDAALAAGDQDDLAFEPHGPKAYQVSMFGRFLPGRARQSSAGSNSVAIQRRESSGSITSSISP